MDRKHMITSTKIYMYNYSKINVAWFCINSITKSYQNKEPTLFCFQNILKRLPFKFKKKI